MTSNNNLLKVGEECLVVVVLDDLVKHVITRDGGRRVWVLVLTATRPLRALPYQSVGGRATTSLEAVGPWVADVLVVAVGKVGCHDGNAAEVDIRVRGDLGKSAEHLRHVSLRGRFG